MINIGVVCDNSWDNFILINNKFKKLNSENFRIHAIYGKTLEIINNCSSKNFLNLIRHYSENLSKTISNLLNVCDIFIVFSNIIEYNTSTRLIIDKCNEYNIKHIIVSEYRRYNDFFSFDKIKDLSFKKIMNSLNKKDKININPFNYEIYNKIFLYKQHVNLSLSPDIRDKLKESYNNNSIAKKEKSIKLLYDKEEIKKEKEIKKNTKFVNQLEFSKNRLNYYKKS